MDEKGIIDKWADRYDIEINLTQVNDYIQGINLYNAGKFDGVTATNMDTLTIPAAARTDTTALIITDYSDGNDAVVMKNGDSVKDLAGQRVNLLQFSVSHYTLARALQMNDMSLRDVTTVNTKPADIAGVFEQPAVKAVTLWNPQLQTVMKHPEATEVFDSSQIPGEILDMLIVNTETLEDNPELGKALVGAWYETMGIMYGDDAKAEKARSLMADAAGTDLEGYEGQLADTFMFTEPQDLVDFATDKRLQKTMTFVRDFTADQGLLGGAPPESIGIQFPDGATLGDADNIVFRFNTEYIEQAANGEL
jgi:NitT/TauT family transport system substrate-binding protein